MNEWIDLDEVMKEDVYKDLELARSTIEKVKRLFENSDYIFLHTMMQESLDAKVRSMLSPPKGMDGVVDSIFNNGKIAGFQEAMNFASILHSGAMGTVDQLKYLDEQKETEDGS